MPSTPRRKAAKKSTAMASRSRKTNQAPTRKRTGSAKKNPAAVRYAVIGLGYFSQVAILPAFAHAKKNSQLVALVSDDDEKIKKLGRKFGVKAAYHYSRFDELLTNGSIDAVYIALPNDMHREFAVRAARAGVHVLVEKPMALTEAECAEMIRAANEHDVRLMIAYRLHLAASNLSAIEIIHKGKIGEPRFFTSSFSMQVKEGNIRTQAGHGGGPVYDIGVYCINAARYLFRAEPIQVMAFSASKNEDARFAEIDEMAAVIMRFPDDRLAQFTCSFGASDTSHYEVIGDQGSIRLEQAYEYAMPSILMTTTKGKTRSHRFGKKDQMAAEILYFSDCVLQRQEPEPSGAEGLADIRIVQAILESLRSGKPVSIEPVKKRLYPSKEMEIERPPINKPDLVHAEGPSQDG